MTPLSSPLTFAVVIPLFDKQGAIESTLASVLAQTRLPDELIIVDDGSSDLSVPNAHRALEDAPERMRWRIISQPNAGVSAARNRGAEASTSNYIAFLDADDEWRPGCLAEFERLARAFPSAGILSVRLAKRSRDGKLVAEPSALSADFSGIVDEPLTVYRKGYGILSSSSVVIHRDAWQKSGGFPPNGRRGEDIYLWLRLLMTERFAHSAQPLSIWRDEYSGAVSRTGAVPFHLEYFLGSSEGRGFLSCRGLVQFLESNLFVHIVIMRLAGDERVARELGRLARSCSRTTRLKCAAAFLVPRGILRAATVGWRKAIRSGSSNRHRSARAA